MSLRARLIAGLLAVAAVGLIALAGATYLAQRSFLLDRVDQQARQALGPMARALDDEAGLSRPGAGGPPPRAGLPPDSYGERRDASGTQVIVGPIYNSFETTEAPTLDLPERIEPGAKLTVDSDSGQRYRVVADLNREGRGIDVVGLSLADVDRTLDRLLVVEAILIGAVLAALAVVGSLLVRLGLRPLDRIGTTAGIIAGGDLARRVTPATPRTEVGRLGLALNAMLDRLEQAFASRQASEDRLRRFLSDASHKLRTPLASIRGYAELFRMGAVTGDEDTEKAARRIEEEATRMGVLVEDLLTLARLDELREPSREPVDLAALARDAVDDARVTAPERSIDVRAEPATVRGDAQQLRQVLGNLLRNALVHTPAGTPIEVAVARDGAEAVLTVRDHGPGLPAGDPAALFERFWRAEGGRERGRAGAGLGLAIVAGVVSAHHGRVVAADAPGGGACFTVALPLSADSQPAPSDPRRSPPTLSA